MARPVIDHAILLPFEVQELESRSLEGKELTEVFHRVEENFRVGYFSQEIADTVGLLVPDENGDLSLGLLTVGIMASDPVAVRDDLLRLQVTRDMDEDSLPAYIITDASSTQPLLMVRQFWRPRQRDDYSPTPSRSGTCAFEENPCGPRPPVDPTNPLASWPAIGCDITWSNLGDQPMPILLVPTNELQLTALLRGPSGGDEWNNTMHYLNAKGLKWQNFEEFWAPPTRGEEPCIDGINFLRDLSRISDLSEGPPTIYRTTYNGHPCAAAAVGGSLQDRRLLAALGLTAVLWISDHCFEASEIAVQIAATFDDLFGLSATV